MPNKDMTGFRKAVQATLNTNDAGAIDSTLGGAVDNQVIPAASASSGHTSVPPKQYDTATPDVQVVKDRSEGFSSQAAAGGGATKGQRSNIRSATRHDLETMTESDLLDMPYIKAVSFDIVALLQVKPKEGAIRFRWVNYKNEEGGNYDKFKAIGFENATVDDVHPDTPIGDTLVKDGNTIKYYDVILMKINTIRLMSAYKANILKSLDMVGRSPERALNESRRIFNNEVSPDMLAAMKAAGHTVDFYIPDKEELDKDDKASKNIQFRV